MRKFVMFSILFVFLILTTYFCFLIENIKWFILCDFFISLFLSFVYTIIVKIDRIIIFIIILFITAIMKSFICNVKNIMDPWSIQFAFPIDCVITFIGLIAGFGIAKLILFLTRAIKKK